MCGIAGYSLSTDVYESRLKENTELQKELIRKAWLHNLHRGYDAAGYMGVAPEKNITHTYKNQGTAVDLLIDQVDKEDFPINTMQVFGSHTRQYTVGHPNNNKNNHPVECNGVFSVHNGHISNHDSLRNSLSVQERSKAPLVDSWIIPYTLSRYTTTPLDLASVVAGLRKLNGSFVTHSIWKDFPGISLLARGNGRPLVIAYNDGEAFFYGSEPESVWAMMDKLELEPNANRWKWESLDTEKLLVLDQGEIIKWAGFKKPVSSAGPQVTTRWLPKEKNVNKRSQKVFETDSSWDYLNKHETRSVKGHEKEAKLRYTRRGGFVNKVTDKEGFPFSKESDIGVSISEADKVYFFNDCWHVLYGNVEIVLTTGRVILDVFNHDLFDNEERFTTKVNPAFKQGQVPNSHMTMEDFMRFHTSALKAAEIPNGPSKYKYVIEMEKADKKSSGKSQAATMAEIIDLQRNGRNGPTPLGHGGKNKSASSTKNTSQTDSASTSEDEEDDDEGRVTRTLVNPKQRLIWENFFKLTFEHKDGEFHFIGEDRQCPTHGELLSRHDDPEMCETVLLAATWTMAAVANLDILTILDREFEIKYDFTDDTCYDRENRLDKCEWQPSQYMRVKAADTGWLICVGEVCKVCGSIREMTEVPSWFNLLDISDTIMISGGYRAN